MLAPADASPTAAMQPVTTQPAQYLEAHLGTRDRLCAGDIDSNSQVTLLLAQGECARVNQISRQPGQVLRDIREFDPNAA